MAINESSGRVLRPTGAAAKLGIGVSTYWLWVKTKKGFPQPFKLGERATGTYERELDAYVATQAAKREAA